MKKTSLIILLFILISCGYKHIDEPGLKGKVKEYTEYKIIPNNKVENDTFSKKTNVFNRNGKVLKQVISQKNGEKFKQDFKYDNKEKLIKAISYYDKNKIIVNYEYKDTLLTRVYGNSESDSISTEMNEKYYYKNNHKLDWVHYSQIILSENDTSAFIGKYYYDKSEKLNKSITQWNSIYDSTFTKTKFEYNKFGLYSKSNDFDKHDSLISKDVYKYEYDNHGSWVKKEVFKNDTLKYIYTRKIDYQ